MRKETKDCAINIFQRAWRRFKWCRVQQCWRSQGSHVAEMISVHSQGGRENRSSTVEQSVSSDHHKLLCLHLTLPATLLYAGLHATSCFSTGSIVTTGQGVKKYCDQRTKATELIFPFCSTDAQPYRHSEDLFRIILGSKIQLTTCYKENTVNSVLL